MKEIRSFSDKKLTQKSLQEVWLEKKEKIEGRKKKKNKKLLIFLVGEIILSDKQDKNNYIHFAKLLF